MSFSIDLVGTRELPPLLDRASEVALSAQGYVRAHTSIDFAGSLFDGVVDQHTALVTEVQHFLATLSTEVTLTGANAIRTAITYYERSDRPIVARDDDGYPRAYVGDLRDVDQHSLAAPPGLCRFDDVIDPHLRFQPPGDHADELPGFHWGLFDAVSPLRRAIGMIWDATSLATSLGLLDRPIDVAEEFIRPLAGDWPGLLRCAEIWRRVGAACRDIDTNLRSNVESISEVWQGNAADACKIFLTRVGEWVADLDLTLRHTADAYEQTAHDVAGVSEDLAAVLAEMVDLSVMLFVELPIAAATAEVGVGEVVLAMAGLDALELAELYQTCVRIVEFLGVAIHGAEIAVATAANDVANRLISSPSSVHGPPTPPALPRL